MTTSGPAPLTLPSVRDPLRPLVPSSSPPTSPRALTRIAHEILERNKGADDVVLLGIPTRGVAAGRPPGRPHRRGRGAGVPVGSLDVTMYRDDLRLRPAARPRAHRRPRRRRRRQGRRARRRRALLRPHRPRRARRARRPRPPPRGPARGPRRPRPPRAADPRRLRRQEPARPRCARRCGCCSTSTTAATASGSATATPVDRHRERRRAMKRHLLSAADLSHDDALLVLDTAEELARAGRPPGQEAAHPARPHRRQPLLRGLHPHPHLLRGRREAAVGRRHQLLRQGLERLQGREPQGHGADPGGDGRRRGRRPPPRQRRAAPAGALRLDPRRRHQRRRRHPRAPDAGAARRVHDARHLAGGTGDLAGRRVTIVGDVLHSRVARSNVLLLHTLGAEVTLVAPPTLLPGRRRHVAVRGVLRPRRGAAPRPTP